MNSNSQSDLTSNQTPKQQVNPFLIQHSQTQEQQILFNLSQSNQNEINTFHNIKPQNSQIMNPEPYHTHFDSDLVYASQNQLNINFNSHSQQPINNQMSDQLCQNCLVGTVSFYIVDQDKRLCEKCAVNEIYKNESYEKIVEKVWNKVKNIMILRKKVCQSINHQLQIQQSLQEAQLLLKQQNSANSQNATLLQQKTMLFQMQQRNTVINGQSLPQIGGVDLPGQLNNLAGNNSLGQSNSNTQGVGSGSGALFGNMNINQESLINNNNTGVMFKNTKFNQNQNNFSQQMQQDQQNDVDMNIERLNLFYDLLQIEIEKLRRKSIDDIMLNAKAQQRYQATQQQHQQNQQTNQNITGQPVNINNSPNAAIQKESFQ
ncbi:UNKNOWN [Stylonychia lemnae]|uniref:Uncharacterized protein n=1 Tax=Stylonychia lemnae TaxID=5949 RepID=A0A078ANK8_STYLE|nr:UNKNOWN [Stylonychia lemnae]|eukprot:CDW83516.1 UNKNOWN [Stylonychia lemnae]